MLIIIVYKDLVLKIDAKLSPKKLIGGDAGQTQDREII